MDESIFEIAKRKSVSRSSNLFRLFVLTATTLENAELQRSVEGNIVNNVSGFLATFAHVSSSFLKNFSSFLDSLDS